MPENQYGCQFSSVVEQRFCKPSVVGSNPTTGSLSNCAQHRFQRSPPGIIQLSPLMVCQSNEGGCSIERFAASTVYVV